MTYQAILLLDNNDAFPKILLQQHRSVCTRRTSTENGDIPLNYVIRREFAFVDGRESNPGCTDEVKGCEKAQRRHNGLSPETIKLAPESVIELGVETER